VFEGENEVYPVKKELESRRKEVKCRMSSVCLAFVHGHDIVAKDIKFSFNKDSRADSHKSRTMMMRNEKGRLVLHLHCQAASRKRS
jgi:hypothetical protein